MHPQPYQVLKGDALHSLKSTWRMAKSQTSYETCLPLLLGRSTDHLDHSTDSKFNSDLLGRPCFAPKLMFRNYVLDCRNLQAWAGAHIAHAFAKIDIMQTWLLVLCAINMKLDHFRVLGGAYSFLSVNYEASFHQGEEEEVVVSTLSPMTPVMVGTCVSYHCHLSNDTYI
jgi:hypothetical protein